MKIELTKNEIKILKLYLEKSLIDAKGLCAIGVVSNYSVKNLESIIKKIGLNYKIIILD